MSSDLQLPCETLEGPCLICHVTPENHEVLLCDGCGSGWHMQCLKPPLDKVPDYAWTCPDCEPDVTTTGSRVPMEKDSIIARVRAVQADSSLTDSEKARRIMDIHCPPMAKSDDEKNDVGSVKEGRAQVNKTIKMLNENLKCMICLDIVNRPVTTPCGHNSCLKCFEKTVQQRNNNCPQCRAPIPHSMRMQPRINSTLVTALRLAAISAKSSTVTSKFQGPPKVQHHVIENAKRPDTFFTSERAVKTGKANAASGKVFVNVSRDHFGPIPAAADPRGTGVLVGENWADRLDCRQWGTHMPHVAGIAGQAEIGAQSVCLSGGYVDDEDHGEWFLYTGSGGRDLSGNKRTNKNQSFDQKFLKSNEALRVSCREGYPVRVVRSHKEKRSSYAPGEKCVRYDGVYRIEACWRKIGIQGYRVCRYLFVRCDNEPAPWSSEENGDRPRPLPPVAEMNSASDVTVRKTQAAWDWKAEEQAWGWTKDPPISRTDTCHPRKVASEKSNLKQERRLHIRMMREFGCVLCQKVMEQPLSTPCGHNFCKSCLLHKFAGSTDIRERKAVGGRSLRAQKVKKACPTCKGDITDFLCAPQVNRQLEDCIKGLLQEDKGEDDVSNPGETVKTDPVSSDEEGDELEEDNEEDSKIPAKSPQRALSSDVQLAEASPNTPLKVTSSGQFSKVAVTSPCEPSGNLVQEVAEDSRGSSVSGKGLLTSEASKHDKLKSPQDADLVVEDSEDDSRVPVQHRKRGRPEEAIAQEVVEDSEDDSPSPVKQRKRGRTREVTENQLATDSAVDVDKTVNTAKTSERDLPQESAPLTDLSNAPERDLRVEQETLAPKRRVRLSRALGKPNKAETSDLNASKTSATCPISLSDSDDDVFVPTRRMTRGFLTATTLKSSKSGLNASQSGLSPGKPIVLP